MPKFTCVQPIEHDHKRFEVDSEITLPDDQAAPLLVMGHILALVKGKKAAVAADTPQADAADTPQG